jgi:hypothetical protein
VLLGPMTSYITIGLLIVLAFAVMHFIKEFERKP